MGKETTPDGGLDLYAIVTLVGEFARAPGLLSTRCVVRHARQARVQQGQVRGRDAFSAPGKLSSCSQFGRGILCWGWEQCPACGGYFRESGLPFTPLVCQCILRVIQMASADIVRQPTTLAAEFAEVAFPRRNGSLRRVLGPGAEVMPHEWSVRAGMTLVKMKAYVSNGADYRDLIGTPSSRIAGRSRSMYPCGAMRGAERID